jgi:hypothetical protein
MVLGSGEGQIWGWSLVLVWGNRNEEAKPPRAKPKLGGSHPFGCLLSFSTLSYP